MKPVNPEGHRKIAAWRRSERARNDASREKARLAHQPVLPMPGLPEVEVCELCFGRGCDKCLGQGVTEARTKECPKCYGVGNLASAQLKIYSCGRCKGKGRVPA